MAADEKWYFTKEQLANTPSRKCGYEVDKELSYRQQAANFIQDMGQRLQVTQLCINTAIVYMHRFYVFHSFTHFHRNAMAAAALFLAAKVEEQPRKLEHVIKVAHMCLNRDQPPLDTKSEKYLEQAQDLVFNENVLLQTLGFDVAIDHPHTHVVRCCHLVRVAARLFYPIHLELLNELTASKDLAQTSYFMASNSLHLTTMCLQYKPTVVACFCIHLACKWSNWEIPQSNEGKDWFWYVDRTVTLEQLEQLTAEFLVIFDKCPTKLKRKIMSISATQNPTLPPPMTGSLFDMEPRRIRPPDGSQQMDGPMFHPGAIQSSSSRPPSHHPSESAPKPPPPPPPVPPAPSSGRVDTYRDYKEKKERERLAQQAAAAAGVPRDGHHGAGAPNKLNTVGKHGQVPPHHRDHNKHPPPVRPGSASGSGVTQARDAVRREQSYAREAQKRELADRHNSDEFMFGPPVRHSEPPLWTAPHIASGMNSGPNCSNNSRKDNQPQQQNRLPVSNSDSRVVKEEVPSNPMQKLPASDAGETQRHAYNHRHGMGSDRHRRSEQYPPRPPEVVTERKLVADAVERRPPDSVERKPSMPEVVDRKPNLPDLSDRKLIVTDLIDRKTSAPDIVDRKPNLVEVIDRKPNLADVVDRKQNFAEVVDRKPNLADVVDRKPNLADVVDRKPNLADIVDRKPNLSDHVERKANVTDHVDRKPEVSDRRPHADIYDNRHDSSSRRPDSSKHQSSQPYHQTPIKRESKPEIKKEEVDHNSRGGSVSRSQPPPPHHHRSQGHEKPPRSRSPAVPPRTKSPISLAPQSKRSDSPHGKQKAVPPHLPTRNGTAVEEKQASRRPETPTVKQEEPPEVLSKSTPVSGDSSHSRSKSTRQRTPPSSVSKKTPSTLLPLPEMPGTPVSPFGSPPPPTPTTPGSSSKLRSTNRNRTSSSSSEPELVPLVTKIDEMKGYKNIIRDSKLGIKIPNRVPDIIPPIRDRVKKEESAVSSDNSSNRSSNSNSVTSVAKELKPPDLIRPFSKPEDLGAVEENPVPTEHHHKSEKKKKKKEHKEHKHKDKDKNREERKHRHKHKEKDKDRHKGETTPIKIKIPKDKINNITLEPINNSVGLKLKIHKDKLTETSPQSAPSGGLKLKISKDMIGGFNSSSSSAAPASVETTPARKRDRSSPRTSELTTPPGPPVKTMRLTTSTGEQRRAANSSNNYGKQNGVEHRKGGSHFSAPGNKVVQKLADTHNAYQSKGSQP